MSWLGGPNKLNTECSKAGNCQNKYTYCMVVAGIQFTNTYTEHFSTNK